MKQYNELIQHIETDTGSITLYHQHELHGEFLGQCMKVTGDLDTAIKHMRITKDATVHDRPRHAWVLYELGDTLKRRSKTEDKIEANALLEQALEIASKNGMDPLEIRIRKTLPNSMSRRKDILPGNLTPREIEVIQHIAKGKTDQEIGDDLFISAKTVSNHVTYILRKIRNGNRTEAARFAAEHSLLADEGAAPLTK